MHALQKILSPSLSCSLREKLANIFAAVSEEIVATANGIDDSGDQPGDRAYLTLQHRNLMMRLIVLVIPCIFCLANETLVFDITVLPFSRMLTLLLLFVWSLFYLFTSSLVVLKPLYN